MELIKINNRNSILQPKIKLTEETFYFPKVHLSI